MRGEGDYIEFNTLKNRYLATGSLGLITELFKQVVEGDGIRAAVNNVAL